MDALDGGDTASRTSRDTTGFFFMSEKSTFIVLSRWHFGGD